MRSARKSPARTAKWASRSRNLHEHEVETYSKLARTCQGSWLVGDTTSQVMRCFFSHFAATFSSNHHQIIASMAGRGATATGLSPFAGRLFNQGDCKLSRLQTADKLYPQVQGTLGCLPDSGTESTGFSQLCTKMI